MQVFRKAAPALARRALFRPAVQRSFATSIVRRTSTTTTTPEKPRSRATKADTEHRYTVDAHSNSTSGQTETSVKKFEDVKSMEDLMPPGAQPGTVPTDLEQATGLERLEILGKMQGVDIFDMRPLDASRKGTVEDPIMVNSFGDEQYVGCTGCPADSHVVIWLTISRDRPLERCPEKGGSFAGGGDGEAYMFYFFSAAALQGGWKLTVWWGRCSLNKESKEESHELHRLTGRESLVSCGISGYRDRRKT
nr:cytochrome c oxidase subunit 4, mitochondrial [Quercus suber]